MKQTPSPHTRLLVALFVGCLAFAHICQAQTNPTTSTARTSPEWREVRLPFSRFRTINAKTDGRLDPGETRALVFVLDGASVKVGTSGTIWIADVGVYR